MKSARTEARLPSRGLSPLAAAVFHTIAVWGTAATAIVAVDVMVRQVPLSDLRGYLGRTAEMAAALIDGDAHRPKFASPTPGSCVVIPCSSCSTARLPATVTTTGWRITRR